ncbi:hypothetical protein L284_13055 [Novosphingobium lindaniclasticum LE124]|uniref:SnoaL-like domain-containing protein n=2 Tax=Novosphingobium TaxID=165696 RepID=T0HQC5_9SPHN|nr:hypothetical protein L284_13055 [Novosphingobium lindaniclasticum LE124]
MLTIEQRLRAIEDRAAITELLYVIASGIDRYDGPALQIAIAPDAVLDMGGETPMTGAAFAAGLRAPATPRPGRMHVVSNAIIQLDGDVACAESQIVSWQDQMLDDEQVTRVRAGRYLDRFVRSNAGWQLSARTLIDEWARIDPVDRTPPQGSNLARPAPDDLRYAHLKARA